MSSDGHDPTAMTFELLKTAVKDGGARLGRLAFSGRRTVDTPNFFGLTSRGVIPHVTPDNVEKHLHTNGTYMALEDFIERPQQYMTRSPPIYETPSPTKKPLNSFTAMPSSIITVLGSRRLPAVASPMGNTNNGISVFTSTGFQAVSTKEYLNAIQTLNPDIAIPLADLTHKTNAPTSKRALRMAERTDDWIKEWFTELYKNKDSKIATFAPVLPISYSMQWEYLERLSEERESNPSVLAGLAVYDADLIPDVGSQYKNLDSLPRLALTAPSTPHQVLRQISLGMDIFLLPFLSTASDAGIALSFTFPPPASESSDLLPLGIDMSSPTHSISLSPLTLDCTCYACTTHHRAFVQHLLCAREMLGWTLLQIHNHAVLASFFKAIRESLADGTFEEKARQFALRYEPEIPQGLGERPRARGYHFKSEGPNEQKKNKPAWSKFEGEEGEEGEAVRKIEEKVGELRIDESGASGMGSGVDSISETPLVPDENADAKDLEEKGFAETVKEEEKK
ncbi:tRNA-guanine(15) transglycosylase-like protein [Sordaria brevicollis]|uniref:Queuine tRNA-ribosyltransferase accessory subunit 2 n=1 Tax=Sordaria brevicollis TaxID=83679 RepID=A0AAE0PMG7_SORBR|nr:tRNA-guanine(15) transglycosylase-like protein [Sordaria brevicollis]